MKVAVLIPVYNAARYLRQCLDSVLAQNGVDLEVFCRDDGSADASRDILAEYANSDGRVHAVSQSNVGVSETRNRLLDGLPSGFDAVAFVDSDDWIAPGMYARLAEALERTGAAIAECEWDGQERIVRDMSVYLLRQTAPGRWVNVINKLYRPSAIGTVRFRSGLKFEEDYFFNFEINAQAESKVLVPGHFYTYRDNPDSATHALDHAAYFDSTSRRILLSLELFLETGRVPADMMRRFREELSRDIFRMCIRKNLRKNPDAADRRELFAKAGMFLRGLEGRGFSAVGLSPVQRMVMACCKSGRYAPAKALAYLT